jgi:hypothetical protein
MLTATSLAKCQVKSNIISQTEFDNIKINNVTFSKIKLTNGNEEQLKNLFTNNITESNKEPEEDYFYYVFNGFNISFSDNIVSSFEITNTDWSLTIKDKTIKIGSHKDELGTVFMNNQVGGGKSIVYQYCDGCNNFLSLYLDSNNLIEKIIYIEQT